MALHSHEPARFSAPAFRRAIEAADESARRARNAVTAALSKSRASRGAFLHALLLRAPVLVARGCLQVTWAVATSWTRCTVSEALLSLALAPWLALHVIGSLLQLALLPWAYALPDPITASETAHDALPRPGAIDDAGPVPTRHWRPPLVPSGLLRPVQAVMSVEPGTGTLALLLARAVAAVRRRPAPIPAPPRVTVAFACVYLDASSQRGPSVKTELVKSSGREVLKAPAALQVDRQLRGMRAREAEHLRRAERLQPSRQAALQSPLQRLLRPAHLWLHGFFESVDKKAPETVAIDALTLPLALEGVRLSVLHSHALLRLFSIAKAALLAVPAAAACVSDLAWAAVQPALAPKEGDAGRGLDIQALFALADLAAAGQRCRDAWGVLSLTAGAPAAAVALQALATATAATLLAPAILAIRFVAWACAPPLHMALDALSDASADLGAALVQSASAVVAGIVGPASHSIGAVARRVAGPGVAAAAAAGTWILSRGTGAVFAAGAWAAQEAADSWEDIGPYLAPIGRALGRVGTLAAWLPLLAWKRVGHPAVSAVYRPVVGAGVATAEYATAAAATTAARLSQAGDAVRGGRGVIRFLSSALHVAFAGALLAADAAAAALRVATDHALPRLITTLAAAQDGDTVPNALLSLCELLGVLILAAGLHASVVRQWSGNAWSRYALAGVAVAYYAGMLLLASRAHRGSLDLGPVDASVAEPQPALQDAWEWSVSAWSPAQLLLVTVSLVTLWDAAVGRVNLDEDDKGNGWALLRRNRAAVRQPAAEESDSAIRGLAAALSLSLAVSKASLSAAAEGSVAVAAVQRCLGRRGTWDAQVALSPFATGACPSPVTYHSSARSSVSVDDPPDAAVVPPMSAHETPSARVPALPSAGAPETPSPGMPHTAPGDPSASSQKPSPAPGREPGHGVLVLATPVALATQEVIRRPLWEPSPAQSPDPPAPLAEVTFREPVVAEIHHRSPSPESFTGSGDGVLLTAAPRVSISVVGASEAGDVAVGPAEGVGPGLLESALAPVMPSDVAPQVGGIEGGEVREVAKVHFVQLASESPAAALDGGDEERAREATGDWQAEVGEANGAGEPAVVSSGVEAAPPDGPRSPEVVAAAMAVDVSGMSYSPGLPSAVIAGATASFPIEAWDTGSGSDDLWHGGGSDASGVREGAGEAVVGEEASDKEQEPLVPGDTASPAAAEEGTPWERGGSEAGSPLRLPNHPSGLLVGGEGAGVDGAGGEGAGVEGDGGPSLGAEVLAGLPEAVSLLANGAAQEAGATVPEGVPEAPSEAL